MTSEPLEELKQWMKSDPDVRMLCVGYLSRMADVSGIDELHETDFDSFATLYDLCADLLSQDAPNHDQPRWQR